MDSGILSVVKLGKFIGLSVGIPLRTVSLAGVSVSGVATVLTKKYQKKLTKSLADSSSQMLSKLSEHGRSHTR